MIKIKINKKHLSVLKTILGVANTSLSVGRKLFELFKNREGNKQEPVPPPTATGQKQIPYDPYLFGDLSKKTFEKDRSAQ